MTPRAVFVHGAGMDHTVWRHQTRWLRGRGWEVVAPDLSGHGRDRGAPDATVEEMAARLATTLDGHPPVTLVGHSMGSLVAVEVAATRPELVESMVLVGMALRMRVHPRLMQAARDDLGLAARLIGGWSFPRAFSGGHPEPGLWQVGATVRLVEASRPGVLAVDLEACRSFDAGARCREVRTPTLVVTGAEDRMTPPGGAEEATALIEGASLHLLAGLGHEPMAQDPRRFNALFVNHLGSVSLTSGKRPQH